MFKKLRSQWYACMNSLPNLKRTSVHYTYAKWYASRAKNVGPKKLDVGTRSQTKTDIPSPKYKTNTFKTFALRFDHSCCIFCLSLSVRVFRPLRLSIKLIFCFVMPPDWHRSSLMLAHTVAAHQAHRSKKKSFFILVGFLSFFVPFISAYLSEFHS